MTKLSGVAYKHPALICSFLFIALTIFDAMVLMIVSFIKGWPVILDTKFHVTIFPIAYPLLNLSWIMGIYLTVLLSLERFHAICMKGLEKKQGNNKRIKLSIGITFLFVCVYNIPKCMEYSWISKTIRTDYDAGDGIWSNLTQNRKYKTLLKNSNHLKFKESYPDIAALGAHDCE